MIIDILTIFPDMFAPVLGGSILRIAQNKGLIKINIHNLRDYACGPHRKVDAPSYGGGGMVFKAEPLFKAVETILGRQMYPREKKIKTEKIILLSPKGKTLNQKLARGFLDLERLLLVAARYEGVDERVREHLVDEEISVGDYVLSGGELAAMVFIDVLTRLIPGVVSDKDSVANESFEKSLLDCPHYTRPPEFRGLPVPEVLLSGDHQAIEKWRARRAREITRKKRPDLVNE